jgi:hypothetical protein
MSVSVTVLNVGRCVSLGQAGRRPVNRKIRIHSTPLEHYALWCASRKDEEKQNKTCLQTFLFQLKSSNNERLLISVYVYMNCLYELFI